jgi:acyl-CoA thioesterase I
MRVTRRAARGERRAANPLLVALLVAMACVAKNEQKPVPDSSQASTHESTPLGDAARRSPPAARRVLFVGTSLTAGLGLEPDSAYPALIQRKIDSAGLHFEVTNAGVSGETTAGLLERLDWLLRGDFAVLVLETGANDGLRGVPADAMKRNLEAAVERIRAKRPDARLVLIQMEALPNLGPVYARDFHNVFPEVARDHHLTLLPFLLDDVAGRRELNQGDGIHPNYVGERIVADNVWKGLKPVLEAVAP